MPIELVAHILSATAELVLSTDVDVALNIARSCFIGYLAATPVIYRMVTAHNRNIDSVGRIFSEEDLGPGPLGRSPSRRLCPLVKTLFIDDRLGIDSRRYSHLINLKAIYCFDYNIGLLLHRCPPLSKLTEYYALLYDPTHAPPETVTHVSIYFSFDVVDVPDFVRDCSKTLLPDTFTHVAIEFNERIDASNEAGVREIICFLLSRSSTYPVTLRLYRWANDVSSFHVVLRAIKGLSTLEGRQRVHLWHDMRPVVNGIEDVALSRKDAFDGRTPWTEASAVTKELWEAVT